MVVSVPCDIGEDYDTSFEMNKFSKKEPRTFCKFCDSEGATHLLLRSDIELVDFLKKNMVNVF